MSWMFANWKDIRFHFNSVYILNIGAIIKFVIYTRTNSEFDVWRAGRQGNSNKIFETSMFDRYKQKTVNRYMFRYFCNVREAGNLKKKIKLRK